MSKLTKSQLKKVDRLARDAALDNLLDKTFTLLRAKNRPKTSYSVKRLDEGYFFYRISESERSALKWSSPFVITSLHPDVLDVILGKVQE